MNIENFLPPLVGSFFGVVAGFTANYAYQSHKNSEDKKKFKAMIKSEIELCISILEQDRIQLLPVDRWTSVINSGALKLFNVDNELNTLSSKYYDITDYNNKAITFQFMGLHWDRLRREDGVRMPIMRVRHFLEIQERLLHDLR